MPAPVPGVCRRGGISSALLVSPGGCPHPVPTFSQRGEPVEPLDQCWTGFSVRGDAMSALPYVGDTGLPNGNFFR